MLWPSRTKLGQAKTWGNFKNMHEGYDSHSCKALGNDFAPQPPVGASPFC